MSQPEMPSQSRKGTKSCSECRRRKIRCIRRSDDAESCRSCEDRGVKCVAQVYTSRPVHEQRLPSRHRIALLEVEVASLRKTVREIQSKLGYQITDVARPASVQATSSQGDDDSDNESNVSDVLATEQPTHLRSLFQNDWLSGDFGQLDQQLQDRKAKASTHLLDLARQTLQQLIPQREDARDMAKTASKWIDLVHALLPQPFAVKSHTELLDSYESMCAPDADAISLASWLLDLAVTGLQEPQDHGSPETSLKRFRRIHDFARAVSDAVESKLISHDRLMGTIEGLGMAMHWTCQWSKRADKRDSQISQGNFQKAWIRMRHFVAMAELLGLPKASQSLPPGNGTPDQSLLPRIQLWEFMCSAERLLCMIVNRPPATRRSDYTNLKPIIINGTVQVPIYLNKLTDITAKFSTLDDLGANHASGAQAYAYALELDRELRVLAAQTPKSWWDQDFVHFKPESLCQLLHYYFLMRVHLPFTMRQDPAEGNMYSRLTCMEACEAVAQRYQALRRMLPSGIFLSPILDLQAFTATTVLLLTSHTGPSSNHLDLEVNKARIQGIAAQVLKVMDEKSRDTTNASFARLGAMTIRSLNALLQQNSDAVNSRQLNLKVPLLGNVTVRRNIDPSQAPSTDQQPFQVQPDTGLWRSQQHILTQPGTMPTNNGGQFTLAQTSAEWELNPLSWSFDTHDNFFQDAFMADSFEPMGMWQTDYDGLQ
ncbi:putative C6 finger domain protein [Fonsecaea pedrosoi]|nr:putative C6 finger domain protein [Fonsecaea pedrosoi]